MVGSTAGHRLRTSLLKMVFVFAACFAAGLVAAGTVAGAGPLGALSSLASSTDDTSTTTTATDTTTTATGTTSTDTTPTDTTPTTTSGVAPPTSPPTLVSDKDDYLPGATVILTGENWVPAEVVRISVNDDEGQTWSRNVDVIAGADGKIRDEFQLPTFFIATYTATATGPVSGTARTTFTDGAVKVSAAPAGTTFTLKSTIFAGDNKNPNTNCSGTGTAEPDRTIDTTDTTVGVGNNDAILLEAVSPALTPTGATFVSWTSPNGAAFIVTGNPKVICVGADSVANRQYRATYTAGNSTPTVARDNASVTVNEGQTATNTGTYSDANASDNVTITASVGTVTKIGTNSGTWSWSFATTDGAAQSQTVTITANDGNGGTATTTFSLVVNNVAPTATLGNSGPVNEGSSATVSFNGQSDPSSADTAAGLHYAFACDNGSLAGATYTGSGTSASTTCGPFPDGPSSQTVRARIIDKDSGFTEYQTTIQVNNVAPTATFNASSPVSEGSPINLSLTSPSDPSSADTTAGFEYAFDCGSGYSAFGASNSTSCATTDNGSRTVKGKIRDKDGGFTEYTANVTINNVAPTADLGNNGPINEGSSATIAFSNQLDPSSADTTAGFHYAYRCDGNASLLPTTYAAAGTSATHSCAFDDNGSYTVRGRIFDKDDGYTTYATTVVVNNVAPVLTAITAPPYGSLYQVNAPLNVTATFTDAGTADTHTCHVDWDDGAGFGTSGTSVTESNGSGTCNASHTYTSAGVYTIKVKVRDDDGDYSNVLEVLVVIYDPSAGFVTGGGWINSPAGAYRADTSLAGRANFGFVSKYKKGATAPEGQTEFQFQTGNLNFHSEAYQWLVVAGAKAQFKGTGKVNGSAGYGFLLTATDGQINGGGGVDKFRIKIWRLSDSSIVYDNNYGASEDIDAASPLAISGGSIVIHSK